MKYPFLLEPPIEALNCFIPTITLDPPENETLIIKDTNNEYHIGYYRDGLYLKSGGYILNAISWRPLFYE